MTRLLALLATLAAVTLPASGQIAVDSSANYGGSWTNGSNGGSGFGNWTLSANGGAGGFAGFFIGNASAAGISGMGPSAFGLFSNNATSGAFADADRTLTTPLAIGQTLSIQLGMNFDSNGPGNKGFNLYSGGTGGTQLININMGGSSTITINGNPLFTNYGTNAMTLNFQRTASTQLRVFGTGRDGSETYDNSFTISGAPDAFRFYSNSLDPGAQRELYFDDLVVVPEPSTHALLALALAAAAWRFRRTIRPQLPSQPLQSNQNS